MKSPLSLKHFEVGKLIPNTPMLYLVAMSVDAGFNEHDTQNVVALVERINAIRKSGISVKGGFLITHCEGKTARSKQNIAFDY